MNYYFLPLEGWACKCPGAVQGGKPSYFLGTFGLLRFARHDRYASKKIPSIPPDTGL